MNAVTKKECITVGCVPTAAVAAIRCQYWGLPTPPRGDHPGRRSPSPWGKNMVPNRKWHQTPLCEQNDTRFWKHYLPLRSVKIMNPKDSIGWPFVWQMKTLTTKPPTSQVTNGILKLTLFHASVIFKIRWIHWISVTFREDSNWVFPKCLNSVTKIFGITVKGLEPATKPPLV